MSALPMLQTSRCIALCALVFVSLDSLCSAGTEPLFYIYHGQPKALTLDSAHVAVRVHSSVANSHTSLGLVAHGFTDADVVAHPVSGWMILNAQNALATSRTRNLQVSAEEATAVHSLITSLLNSGDPTIEFVSPVFRDKSGDPIILAPTLLIGFQEDFSAVRQSQLLAAVPEGAEPQKVEFPQPHTQRWQLHSHDGFAALDHANALAQTPGVAYAELDMIVTGHSNLIPTDPLFTQSWGLKNTGQSGGQVGFDMEATSAWDITTGSSSVIVLILDVGVQQDHPDINQVTGKDFTSDAPSNPNGGPFGVYDNHGTWVAGCISGLINNGLGTVGIAPGVKVASARCYNNGTSSGTYTFQFSWVVDALNWGQSIGARISNNSNYYNTTSSAIEDAYATTRTNGMIHFASAGNDGTGSISYPSSISSVNSVGAANRFGQRSSFSQYGPGLKYLAPGEQIYTTDRTGSAGGVVGDYELVDGTSFASPYAAGVAALVISQTPSLSVSEVESRMQNACTDMGPTGYDTGYGYGMLDAFRAVTGTVAPLITSNLNPPSVVVGNAFTYQITSNNSPTSFDAVGLPTGVQVNKITGLITGTPTIFGTFPVVVSAHGSTGDASATVQIVVIGPTITSWLTGWYVEVGTPFSYSITANNSPSSYGASGLPSGLQLNTSSGLISGTPTVVGTFAISLIAHGALGDATGTLQLTVSPRQITSSLSPYGEAGDPFSYQITADNSPSSFQATNLPSGLQLNSSTGLISGMVTVSGWYYVNVVAQGSPTNATGVVQMYFDQPQIISSLVLPPVQVGGIFSYQITTTNHPASYSASGLPPGLSLNSNTGLISGIPSLAGNYSVTIRAITGITISNALTISVVPAAITSSLSSATAGTGIGYLYLITAGNNPTSFSATGLPPGLQLDPVTGAITGVPNLSGTYTITVTAHGAYGDASGTFQITIAIPQSVLGALLQKITLPVTRFAADPVRSRVYATISSQNQVAVIDSSSLAVIKFIQVGSNPIGLAVSADGSKLWVANSGSTTSAIGVIDLNTLQTLPSLPAPVQPSSVVEGSNNKLYVTPAQGWNSLMQIDSTTGICQSFSNAYGGNFLAISPDRQTLFLADQGISPSTLLKFDVSGATPVLLQQAPFNSVGSNGEDLKLSHNGQFLCFPNGGGNGYPYYSTYEIPASDITAVNGVFTTGAYPGPAAFSNDDAFVYQDAISQSKIYIFNSSTFNQVATIDLGFSPNSSGGLNAADLVVDNSDSRLFVAANDYFGFNELRVYDTGRAHSSGPAASPPPHSLVNVSTRTFVQIGDNVEIGGFIIHGDQPKKVVLRAIGPSLAAYGLPAVTDPVLELHDSTGAIVVTNDNWNSHRQDVLNTGLAPSDEHESVIVTTLAPGAYTGILRGLNGAIGTALFELYDVDPANSKVTNISTRSNVQTGDNVMIGGFIIGGGQPTNVIVRAIGPSLTQYGVSDALLDPVLELHDGSGNIVSQNDDWRSDQEQAIIDSHLAPSDDHESAILTTLAPGSYTAIVRGKNNTTGVALVEVYNLDSN